LIHATWDMLLVLLIPREILRRAGQEHGRAIPLAEGGIASRAILVGIEVITTELEMGVDPTMGGEKALRMTRSLETFHLSFSSPCRLV
jgi:hypothetical protein